MHCAPFFLIAAATVACSSPPTPTAPPTPAPQSDAGVDANEMVNRGTGIWLKVEPDDAEVLIDDYTIGKASSLEDSDGFLELEAGLHQLVIRKEGYKTWRAEVTVGENTEPIEVSLEPLPQQ